MNLRKLTLLANITLLIVVFTSLFWSAAPNLLAAGFGLGLVFSIPSLIAFLAPDRVSDRLLLGLNLTVMLALSVVTISQLYNQLLDATGQPVVGLVIILFLCLALGASLQLLIVSAKKSEVEAIDTLDSCLHKVYGGPSVILALSVAIIMTGVLQSLVFALSDMLVFFQILEPKLLQRGVIPYLCLILFFWGALLLCGNYVIVHGEHKRVSSDAKKGFLNLESATFKSLQLLFKEGRVGNSKTKKAECIEKLSDHIWNKSEHLYSLPRYINWAIPILGFIGTVLGISLAAESIGGLISSPDTNFSSALGDAVAPLGIAFDTTLVALSLSVVLMFGQTVTQRWQERQLQHVEQTIRDSI